MTKTSVDVGILEDPIFENYSHVPFALCARILVVFNLSLEAVAQFQNGQILIQKS